MVVGAVMFSEIGKELRQLLNRPTRNIGEVLIIFFLNKKCYDAILELILLKVLQKYFLEIT